MHNWDPLLKPHILIADEDATTRDLIKSTLGSAFRYYEVTVSDCIQSSFHSARPFFAFIDVDLCGREGGCSTAELLAVQTDAIVVLLLPKNTPDLPDRGLARGAAGELSKPLDPKKLIQIFWRLIDARDDTHISKVPWP